VAGRAAAVEIPGVIPLARRALAGPLALAGLLTACASGRGAPPRAPSAATDDPAADRAMVEERWADAVELHRELLSDRPGDGVALYHLGYSLGSLGRHREEADAYVRALDAGYDPPDLLYNLGLARLALGDAAGAVDALERAVAASPGEAEVHHASGRALLAAGEADRARERFERALELDPEHEQARRALAELGSNPSRRR
jgi:tetratricopeptide (TPR) repeat protein